MNHRVFILSLLSCLFSQATLATDDALLQQQIEQLQKKTHQLQVQLSQLQKKTHAVSVSKKQKLSAAVTKKSPPETPSYHEKKKNRYTSVGAHTSNITVHLPDADPESLEFYPTALVADEHVVTYIAGTPVVTSPYLGSRPAFDGSDYIVNISSINRDIRLLQQRRRFYRAYDSVGYPAPNMPILAISGKIEPLATVGDPFVAHGSGDITLGSNELDLAAILNKNVEAYMALAYADAPPDVGGQRLSNSSVNLNMAFVNIGDLDRSPFYFTGGQLFVPFGRFSSAMVSAPLTMVMARTKSRPFILGYKSQNNSGPYTALSGFRSDTTLGQTGTGGLNAGYVFDNGHMTTEVGGSIISSVNDAGGMQFTASYPGTTFGGFSSLTNGSERVRKTPAAGVHTTISVDRYNITAEWVSTTTPFRVQDLSFNGKGAHPEAGQLEVGVTFHCFDKPASLAAGYQWTKEALALNLPEQRLAGVFNISLWQDTIESLEYRHDINYNKNQYANGASPTGVTNANTIGPGGASDTVLLQIGVFF